MEPGILIKVSGMSAAAGAVPCNAGCHEEELHKAFEVEQAGKHGVGMSAAAGAVPCNAGCHEEELHKPFHLNRRGSME